MAMPAIKTSAAEFRELCTSEEWLSAFPVLQEFRHEIKLNELLENRRRLQESGYHLLALLVEDRVVAIAGVVVNPHILRGSDLRVNDLATLSTERSKGYGRYLLERVRDFAKSCSCSRILLYSQHQNTDAHRFYEQQAGFKRYGIEFVSEIG